MKNKTVGNSCFRSWLVRIIPFCIPVCVLTPLFCFSQTVPYKTKSFRIEDNAVDLAAADVAGSGFKDILVFHTRRRFPEIRGERFVSIYVQDSTGFPEQPALTRELRNEILYDTGDMDGDGKQELLFLERDGIYRWRPGEENRDAPSTRIIETGSVLQAHDPEDIRRWDLLEDIDEDGRYEVIVPEADQIHIYESTFNGTYRLKQRLWSSQRYHINGRDGLTFSLTLPRLVLADYNGDSLRDILLIHDRNVNVFLQHPRSYSDSLPSLSPPDLRYNMDLWNVQSANSALPESELVVEIADLNHDGYADMLLSSAPRASFTHSISQIQIYMNKMGRYGRFPDQVLTTDNFGGEHVIKDFNGDGLTDLAMLTFKVGFIQAAKFFLTRKTSNSYHFHFMSPGGITSPSGKVAFSRKFYLNELFGTAMCVSFDGDFNADGKDDFLIGTDTEELSIHYAEGEGRFSKKAGMKITAPPSGRLLVQDINEDGFADIMMWYPPDHDAGQWILIQSQNP